VTDTQRPALTPERLMQMAWGFAPPLIIEAALRNGVFETLGGEPRSAEQVAAASGAALRGVAPLLDALVGLALLEKSDSNPPRYALTPETRTFLVPSSPGYRGAIFRHISSQLIPGWLGLAEIVRTGRPAVAVNQESAGGPFFHDFVESLFSVGRDAAQALAAHLKAAGTTPPTRLLDLAAGSGVWSISVAEAFPLVRVTAVDWPAVLPVTRRVVERHGLADRYDFVAGDLGDAAFGEGYDLALLGQILHSEGPERSRALLRRCFDSLAPGGRIVIAEFLVDEDRRGPLGSLIFTLNMLAHTDTGTTFSFAEVRGMLTEAGFVEAELLPVPAPSPLVLARRPDQPPAG